MNSLNFALSNLGIKSPSLPDRDQQITSPIGASDWDVAWNQLALIRRLGNDWDGLGADAPSSKTIELAELALRQYQARVFESPPARVMPTLDGGIIIEWQHGTDVLEFEIDPDGDAAHGQQAARAEARLMWLT